MRKVVNQRLRLTAARRIVLAEHRSGFGGQCRLANAAVSLSGLRGLEREGLLLPVVVAKLHREACQARTKLRDEIRVRAFRSVVK